MKTTITEVEVALLNVSGRAVGIDHGLVVNWLLARCSTDQVRVERRSILGTDMASDVSVYDAVYFNFWSSTPLDTARLAAEASLAFYGWGVIASAGPTMHVGCAGLVLKTCAKGAGGVWVECP